MDTRERSIGIEGDVLLEEPGSDVGVSIDGETVAADHHHLISAWTGGIAGRVGVRDGVLVRDCVCGLPMPLANVERVFGTSLGKDLGRIFRADARASVRTARGPGTAPRYRAVAVQRVPVGDRVTWVVSHITIELEYECRRYRPCDRGRGQNRRSPERRPKSLRIEISDQPVDGSHCFPPFLFPCVPGGVRIAFWSPQHNRG